MARTFFAAGYGLLCSLLLGCGQGGQLPAQTQTLPPIQATPAEASPLGCDWILTYPRPEGNSAYPDTHTRYWYASVDGRWPAGSRLLIRGQYSDARYSALHLYDGQVFFLDALADYQIQALPGSRNPFSDAVTRQGPVQPDASYQVTVPLNGSDDSQSNMLERGALGVSLVNRLLLVYRLYLPEDDQQGGVALPQLEIHQADGQRLALGRGGDCAELEQEIATAAPGPLAGLLATTLPAPRRPVLKPADDALLELLRSGVGYNPHNSFLRAKTDRRHGDVLLIRGRHAPHTPQRNALVRYWSICQYGAASTRAYACVADQNSAVDEQGYFTIAISSDEWEPEYLNRARGFSWLPWGDEDKAIVLLRQLLAQPPLAQDSWQPAMSYCDRETVASLASQGAAQTFALCQAMQSR